MISAERVNEFLVGKQSEATDLLCELIRFPSTRGNEGPAMQYLHQRLRGLADECELVPIPESIIEDEHYAFRLEGMTYAGRPNLRLLRKGSGGGKSVVFNTHMDVVPPSKMQQRPFDPVVRDGVIYGRGACDAKGQVVTLYLLLAALRDLGLKLKGDVEAHVVIEEECGANGSLAMARRGCRANAAVVMEPSGLTIMPSIRGAVWFELSCYGRAGHSGSAGPRISAIKKAYEAMGIMEGYHDRLLAASKGHPLYDRFENPMPVTFGMMQAGEWPAATPDEAVVKGVFGFLPPKTKREIQREIGEAIAAEGDEWLRENFDLRFPMLNLDPSETGMDDALVTTLQQACRQSGVEPSLSALTGSCDATHYRNIVGVPTVVFGPGSLGHAHSKDEQIAVEDILGAAGILANFLINWCGG
jgi:acetylornithine deacetylase